MSLVKHVYPVPLGDRCMHEFVASARSMARDRGVRAMDIGKRLIDYNYHAPTVYFPLIVPEALMIEPTETESRETLEAFAEALLAIAAEDPEAPPRRPRAPRRSAGPTRSRPPSRRSSSGPPTEAPRRPAGAAAGARRAGQLHLIDRRAFDDDRPPSEARPMSIVVEDFHKIYDRTLAVSGLSFRVEPGEILGLVGPNGAGKTTTMRALAGILEPTQGRLASPATTSSATRSPPRRPWPTSPTTRTSSTA